MSDAAAALFWAVVGLLIASMLLYVPYQIGHRAGQIAALTGRATIELQEQEDGTRVWGEKEVSE